MNVERDNFVFDRSYGRVNFSEFEYKLFQTKEIARLRQISLSATPPWLLQAGNCATRFEHSLGVAHLAKIVGANSDFQNIANDLYFAALAHDIGSPPFSHLSEGFLTKHIGVTHEEYATHILNESEYALEVTRQGGSIENIQKLILGKLKPASDVLNGSVDIDNLDNILRYGLSLGLINNPPYLPEKIAAAFRIDRGRAVLLSECIQDLTNWEESRRFVYDYVYNVTNISPNSMLHRAIDFASKEGEISESFFRMTDTEAFSYLKNNCNPRTRILLERADLWHFYPAIMNMKTFEPTEKFKELVANDDRGKVADQISKTMNIPPEDVCVYLRKSRGYRKIHLPILDPNGNHTTHEQSGATEWIAQVYVYPKHMSHAEEITELSESILEIPKLP